MGTQSFCEGCAVSIGLGTAGHIQQVPVGAAWAYTTHKTDVWEKRKHSLSDSLSLCFSLLRHKTIPLSWSLSLKHMKNISPSLFLSLKHILPLSCFLVLPFSFSLSLPLYLSLPLSISLWQRGSEGVQGAVWQSVSFSVIPDCLCGQWMLYSLHVLTQNAL